MIYFLLYVRYRLKDDKPLKITILYSMTIKVCRHEDSESERGAGKCTAKKTLGSHLSDCKRLYRSLRFQDWNHRQGYLSNLYALYDNVRLSSFSYDRRNRSSIRTGRRNRPSSSHACHQDQSMSIFVIEQLMLKRAKRCKNGVVGPIQKIRS